MSVPYKHIHYRTVISSLFASHVYSPYSIQIDSKQSVDTQIPFLTQVMFKPILRTD